MTLLLDEKGGRLVVLFSTQELADGQVQIHRRDPSAPRFRAMVNEMLEPTLVLSRCAGQTIVCFWVCSDREDWEARMVQTLDHVHRDGAIHRGPPCGE